MRLPKLFPNLLKKKGTQCQKDVAVKVPLPAQDSTGRGCSA